VGRRGPKTRVTPEQILEAAEACFDQNGYGETSLRQLIAATGVSSTAFYARYPSKEAVLAALVENLLGGLLEVGLTVLPKVSSRGEMFEQVPLAMLEVVRRRRTVVRLACTEAPANPSIRPALESAYQGLATMITSFLSGQVERGILRVDPASLHDMAWSIVGAVYFQIMRWAVFDHFDDEAALLRGLRAAVRLPWAARQPRNPDALPAVGAVGAVSAAGSRSSTGKPPRAARRASRGR
jgi:AcrR family transcriptional regulator